jgi:hypothetical protein
MKMFTRFIGPMMMLLLISTVVVIQAQGDTKSAKGNFSVQKSDVIVPTGSGDIFAIPGNNSFESQYDQKGISGTDDMKVVVLAHNGYVSTGRRAPSNGSNYQREIYLIKPADMAASGIPSGTNLNSIGWTVYAAGNTTLTGTLNIWLMNTSDATYNVGLDWATAIAGFQQVYTNASYTVPIALGWFDVATTNFNYTGGGVYVAWEFSSTGTPATTVVSHYIYNDTPSSFMASAYNNTSLPLTLAAGAVRPQTRFGLAGVDDIVGITSVYTLEKAPVPYGVPVKLGAGLQNISASPVTTNVTIEVRKVSDNSLLFSNTASGFTIPASSYAKVAFADWTSLPVPPVDVKYVVSTAPIPGDTWTVNNTKTILGDVNNNLYSYFYTPTIVSNFGGAAAIFANKFTMNGTGLIEGIKLVIGNHTTNTGKVISAVLLNSAGGIVAQTAPYTILLADLGLSKTFMFTSPVSITNDFFYAGIYADMLLGVHYPVALASELPQRGDMIYTFDLTGGEAFEETLDFKCLIEAMVYVPTVCDPPSNLYVSNIATSSANLNWTSLSGLSDVAFGPAGFTLTNPTHPGVTSPITVTTAMAQSYDFYVRDVCSGPIYSTWAGPYTFTTLCETCTGTPEGEPQLPDGSTLAGINGGCAVGDPLLTSPIALGQTYCGQSNSFINDLGQAARDNDYYYLNLTTPANIYWNLNITLKGNGLYNLTVFNAGNMDCAIGAVASVTTTSSCELATINVDVPSGNYYIVARVATAAGNLWSYGSGPWTYVLSVTGGQLGAPNMDPDPPVAIEKLVPPGGTASENWSIGNIGSYALNYSASTSGAYSLVWQDNFDAYTDGVQLACQAPANWTTWSNAPCDPVEDGYVSSAYAFSGANSAKIGPDNDQVKLFGDLSSGVYRISFMQYIPSGKAGYFNILSAFTFGTGGYWGPQVYFNVDGTGELDANHTAIDFTWVANQWKKVEVIVDLDNDAAEFIYDGTSVYSWPWTQGSSAGTGPLIIDAMDLFGATADDEMYIDDLKLELAGNDWLTLNGGLGVSGTVNVGAPAVNVTIGFNSAGKPVGEYTKTINLTTNELGAKTSYSIPVTMRVGYNLTGTVYYGLTDNKALWTNTTVTLTPTSPSGPPINVTPSVGGGFDIRPLGNGSYALTGAVAKPWGGMTTFDATLILRYAGGVPGFGLTDLQKRAADVNMTNTAGGVTTFDATLILRKATLPPGTFPPQWTAPLFVFDGPYPSTPALIGLPVTVSGANVTQNLRTLCSGDVNGSYISTIPFE